MKSREEQLSWAKQRALICVDMGRFSDAVAGLRADLDENSPDQRPRVQRARNARIQSGDGRGARPRFASADRVDRRPQVTHCTGPSALGRQPQDDVAVALARPAHDWSASRSLPPRPRRSDRLFPNFAEWWQTPLLFT